jgi:hypothetical protein
MDNISGVTNEIAPGLFFNNIGSLFAETTTSSNLIVFRESDVSFCPDNKLAVHNAQKIRYILNFIFFLFHSSDLRGNQSESPVFQEVFYSDEQSYDQSFHSIV